MSIPQLTPFPDPPRIYQPEEEFDAKADEMAGHLPILVNEINAMADAVNTELADIDSSVNAAADSATAAANSASAALTSKNAAADSATAAANSASAALTSKNAAADSATAAAASVNPVGTIIFYAKSTVPTGYLKANGAAVSRTSYAALFAVVGTIFGAGDGSTTFNLPDLRGEFLRGWDDTRGADNGRVFGSVQSDLLKQHGHDVGHNDGHLMATSFGAGSVSCTWQFAPNAINANTGYGQTWRAGSFGGDGSTGQGAETRPRNIALLACIRY